jgi:hypothetical protein
MLAHVLLEAATAKCREHSDTITALTAEVERLKQEHANATIVIRVSNNAHAETIAENARLTAEVERLRKVVSEALTKVENDRTMWNEEWLIWAQDARAALEEPRT